MSDLKKILSNFAKEQIANENLAGLKSLRQKALDEFIEVGFPGKKDEDWQDLNIDRFLKKNYSFECSPTHEIDDFSCQMVDIDSSKYYLINSKKLIENNGHIKSEISVKNILDTDENILNQHFNKIAKDDNNGFNLINTAAFTGGFFINVPDNTNAEIPLQFISLNNCNNNSFSNIRNLIIVGRNSTVKIIQCDDTIHNNDYFINSLTEIFVAENSNVELYKMYNLSNYSAAINSIYINQEENSVFKSFYFELNAGLLRNNLYTNLNGKKAESLTYGIYFADKQQQMDNNVRINHIAPSCYSEQIFKGIVDDMGQAIFNGLIVVDREAQKTVASQINRNILLTDKAKTVAKPFLEIYADDVKCSHGATNGQLDENALFYLQARGISFEKARMLLLHAFVGEIINKIKIEAISLRINDLVKKRLNGELSDCSSCVLKCSDAKVNKECY
ncbi:Fe-S cluster assembly protein SufD [Bacteroidales bacterium OttesenSCG-928-K03]|nr:Fe-S cluster assembly protein SufD [Odoribacter sp. OttesenSCG-928-L07]MDL2239420.1 Fe-S cluster assembly protein SufD [Bacteroidales bacterium OttesenSCG-928-L14]MDL2240997.1 Fe-S cluster assembly protein SufD [Bacteroidales bacterium OttesenSCG-928-K22]MDL2242948.1 Fe-S cluster assembly protein SufD [Bacteroidales bacterium OttesenSCG-928-K03]